MSGSAVELGWQQEWKRGFGRRAPKPVQRSRWVCYLPAGSWQGLGTWVDSLVNQTVGSVELEFVGTCIESWLISRMGF